MNVTILGAGRLGLSLGERSVRKGYQTTIVFRERSTDAALEFASAFPAVRLEAIKDATCHSPDLVVLAAPAFPDSSREASLVAFLNRLPESVFVASAVAVEGAALASALGRAEYVRFMCSPAIRSSHLNALALVERREHPSPRAVAAVDLLLTWLAPLQVVHADSALYSDLSRLFVATALHCLTLQTAIDEIEDERGRKDALVLRQLAAETLLEAHRLLGAFQFDPGLAFDACATPQGLTIRKAARHTKRANST